MNIRIGLAQSWCGHVRVVSMIRVAHGSHARWCPHGAKMCVRSRTLHTAHTVSAESGTSLGGTSGAGAWPVPSRVISRMRASLISSRSVRTTGSTADAADENGVAYSEP